MSNRPNTSVYDCRGAEYDCCVWLWAAAASAAAWAAASCSAASCSAFALASASAFSFAAFESFTDLTALAIARRRAWL